MKPDGAAAVLRHRCRRPFGADRGKLGAEARLVSCSSSSRPAQALAPIRDQLVRIALLIGLGLIVAIARRHAAGAAHADPDHRAARRRPPARRRRFQPSHRRPHLGRAGGARRPVQQHGRPARRDLFGARRPRSRSAPATSRTRSTNSRCSRRSAARSPPRSISTRCCRRWRPARSRSPMPTRS